MKSEKNARDSLRKLRWGLFVFVFCILFINLGANLHIENNTCRNEYASSRACACVKKYMKKKNPVLKLQMLFDDDEFDNVSDDAIMYCVKKAIRDSL